MPERVDALWVVDSQQRITSLINAVNQQAWDADTRFRLDYDPASEKVVHHREGSTVDTIPLSALFDLRILLQRAQKHPELVDRIADLNEVATRLQNFELPASIVKDATQEEMQDIFDRMNSSGKRLRRAEIFSAIYGAEEFEAGEALSVAAIGDEIAGSTTFGRIDDNIVLQAILSRRGSDPARDIRIEFDEDARKRTDFPDESKEAAHRHGAEALRRGGFPAEPRRGSAHRFPALPISAGRVGTIFRPLPRPRPT